MINQKYQDQFINGMEAFFGETDVKFLIRLFTFLKSKDLILWHLVKKCLRKVMKPKKEGLQGNPELADIKYIISEFRRIANDLESRIPEFTKK